jgi:hypothetical protein
MNGTQQALILMGSVVALIIAAVTTYFVFAQPSIVVPKPPAWHRARTASPSLRTAWNGNRFID